jgi:hypothetical protein
MYLVDHTIVSRQICGLGSFLNGFSIDWFDLLLPLVLMVRSGPDEVEAMGTSGAKTDLEAGNEAEARGTSGATTDPPDEAEAMGMYGETTDPPDEVEGMGTSDCARAEFGVTTDPPEEVAVEGKCLKP